VPSRVVVEVTGLTFRHYSKSVANNYGVYVEVSNSPQQGGRAAW
jgi:hypothetical protein